jgi:hypothetical protein
MSVFNVQESLTALPFTPTDSPQPFAVKCSVEIAESTTKHFTMTFGTEDNTHLACIDKLPARSTHAMEKSDANSNGSGVPVYSGPACI